MSDQETERIYAAAGIGQTIVRGERPAVLIVDFSVGFTHPEHPVGCDLSAPVLATARLLECARRESAPVFFTTIAYEPSLRDGGVWLQKMPGLGSLVLGSRLVEIDDRLGRRAGETLIVKKGASTFFATNLASPLSAERIDTLIVGGATTSGCVRASVVDAVQCGFPTLVVAECVGDRARPPHDANLFDMNAKYADVVALDDVLGYLAVARVTA